MSNCHACQAAVDTKSLAAGVCQQCGAKLRTLPQRTIQDVRSHQVSLPEDLPEEEVPDPSEQETVLMEPEGDTKDDVNLELPATEEFAAKETTDSESQQTVDLGDEDLDIDELLSDDIVDEIDELIPESGGEAEPTSGDDQDDTGESKKPPTISIGREKTIDFNVELDPTVSDSLVTAQWKNNVSGSEVDSGATIKQKETVEGPILTRSSLVVKSRQVRSPDAVGQPIDLPADAPDYELLDIIGEGGMGVVYAAKQSAIARTVAVKMLKGANKHTLEQREKFISEAVVTGELDHPNIVPIYDLGANDAGALFYSMKRVRGTPWNDVIQSKSLGENLNILLRISDAIAFAHANGVLHRDLKPENVMLGDFGEVLVMDWGLARISPEFPNADVVSQSDAMGGTPAYMAPEMATGPIESITTASDIYLLGAMLFEVVTGRPPHSGKTVMACLFAAAKNKIVQTDHAGELMDVALRAMATNTAERHASVQEFQTAIRQYQSHSESIVLTDSAANKLEQAIERDDYDRYSRAQYGFQEALSMWDGNRRAAALLSSAQAAYAQSALDRGDFDLGISLLDPADENHTDVLAQLQTGRKERDSRNRRLTFLKKAVAALLIAVMGIVSVAFFLVSRERDKALIAEAEAVEARDEEEKARVKAEEEEQKAVEARVEEEKAKLKAQEEEEKAVAARKDEEIARLKAVEEEKKAVQARDEAVLAEAAAKKAKKAEEYEAYVARIGLASAKIGENAFDRANELLEQCSEKLCHWEWGRLKYLCQLSQQTWHVEGPVDSVAFSPDGRLFATGDLDGKTRIWNLETGKELQAISHGQYVHSVAFDRPGKRLASGSSDRTIRILQVRDGRLLQTLEGHTDAVLTVRFAPDGKTLLSAGYDNTARIWDLQSGQVVQTLSGHSWWVWAAEFSPDGSRIVTTSQDGKAIVWQRTRARSPRYEYLTEFTRHRGPVYAARFSPEGGLIATAGYDRQVLLWDPDQVQPVDIARRLDAEPDPPAPFRSLGTHDGPVRTVTDKKPIVLRGHASHVRDVSFSPDGKQLLSAGRDGLIKLWRPEQYRETVLLGEGNATTQPDAVLAARFSCDGKQIVTASRDRTAALWDVSDLTRAQSFSEGHVFLASAAIFFSDGTRLATGAGDGTTRIWDVATGTEISHLMGTGRTAALAVSRDGQWIVTGGAGNEAVVWDVLSGERLAELKGHEAAVTAVAVAPNGQRIATGDDRGRCRLWKHGDSSAQWEEEHLLRGHSRTIEALSFADQGRRLITASGDNTCGQWEVASGQELSDRVLTHPDWIADMDVSNDGTRALTCCDDGSLRLWSLSDARVLRTIKAPAEVVYTSVDLSPDGQLAIAACAANGTVQVWRLDTGREIRSEQNPWLSFGDRSTIVWAARFAPEGRRVLTIGGNDARIWDLASREPVVRFSPHGTVAAADLSPDGRLLVTGSWDRSAKIWDAETGKALRKLEGVHQGFINSVEFSPNGTTILTASDDGTARLWEVQTGNPLEPVLRGHQSRIRQARFSHDGNRVLTVANDKTARIWDARTGKSLITLVGHEWAVLSGEFSRDGKNVITGSKDNTAMIWNVDSGQPLLKLSGHTDSITAVAFSPDGRRALTGSQDNVAKLWDASTGKEILTLSGHREELTSVSFSPDGLIALTSGRDGAVMLWPAIDWHGPRALQDAFRSP